MKPSGLRIIPHAEACDFGVQKSISQRYGLAPQVMIWVDGAIQVCTQFISGVKTIIAMPPLTLIARGLTVD